MLEGFKRLFTAGQSAPAKGWEGIAPWAEGRQYSFRGGQSEGFVIDGRLGATPWRLEWGPSQRPYILGQELRLRAEMGLVSDLQVVLLNRVLQEQILTLAVTGEVQNFRAPPAQFPADRKQHRVAKSATEQQHRFSGGSLARLARRSHDNDRLTRT